MQLDDTLDGFWLSKRRNLSSHTVQDYGLAFRRFTDFMGADREFSEITAEDVNRFLEWIEEEFDLAPKTMQNHWAALSSLWTWAEKALNAKHVIRGHVDRPKVRSKQVQPYREQEVRALLAARDKTNARELPNGKEVTAARGSALRDKAIILVLLDCGLRVSELCDLKIADYDPKHGQLIVRHGKGDKERILFLGDAAQTAIWRYLAARFPTAKL